jgi:hypothetical protein
MIDRLWRPGLWDEMFGKAVILGAAMCDPGSGRAMVASGLFHQLTLELRPELREALTDEAKANAWASLPLASALVGVASPLETRAGPPASQLALSGDSRVVVTLGSDGMPAVWDARRGVLQPFPLVPASPARDVWANRDGSSVALSVAPTEVQLLSRRRPKPLPLPSPSGAR